MTKALLALIERHRADITALREQGTIPADWELLRTDNGRTSSPSVRWEYRLPGGYFQFESYAGRFAGGKLSVRRFKKWQV